MPRRSRVTHQFVETVPDDREEGVIYVSVAFETAIHSCLCGCGTKVVTPFSPTDWTMIFDGDTVSLMPSIGNWDLECESHYWIWKNKVKWDKKMSKKKIEAGRKADERAKRRYYRSDDR